MIKMKDIDLDRGKILEFNKRVIEDYLRTNQIIQMLDYMSTSRNEVETECFSIILALTVNSRIFCNH